MDRDCGGYKLLHMLLQHHTHTQPFFHGERKLLLEHCSTPRTPHLKSFILGAKLTRRLPEAVTGMK